MDEKAIRKIIREAVRQAPDPDATYSAARDALAREIAEQWWCEVYRSPISWLDKVIDRDALTVRVEREAEILLDQYYYEEVEA